MQHTSRIIMIRPVHFSFNEETAVDNHFQVSGEGNIIQEKALKEFNTFIEKLKEEGIEVIVFDDSPEPYTPDSVFPNNWISFHEDGTVFLYPMFAENRRKERKDRVLDHVSRLFTINQVTDLSAFETGGLFLEGTGSMVLDRDHKIAYACLSQRTDDIVLNEFCERAGYRPIPFSAVDENGLPIYHTNVMMCVAETFTVICLDSIKDATEKKTVLDSLKNSGKEIIEISYAQMNQFAGNMLQVHNKSGKKYLVMSTQAFNSLTTVQIDAIEKENAIIHSDISTIETHGGGSARCMMAEVFLPLKQTD